jgi:hypothetical protein
MIIALLSGVFILALHTKISPLLLGLPFHHCIFCLCQEVWVALLSVSMIFTGLTLFLLYSWVVSLTGYGEVREILDGNMVKLLKFSGMLMAMGLIILSVHLLIVLR